MRILYVATISETLRGFFLPFVDYFRRHGWTVDGAASGIESCPDCRAHFDSVTNIAWSRNPVDPRNVLSAPARVREIVTEGRYDIVHVNTPVAAFVTRMALRDRDPKRGPSVVYTAHGFHFHNKGRSWRNAVFLGLERMAAPWTDYLVVMNQFDFEMAGKHGLAPAGRLQSIPGIGVDRSYYRRESLAEGSMAAIRRELGLTGEPLLLMIGEFIARKRHADAIRAMERLRDTNVHLVLAGSGPLEVPMRRLAKRLGVADRVHFLGVRRDVPALLGAAYALVLPSEHEGLPRAILEAMSMGVPVVGSDVRGTRDLLASGAGRLFPIGDIYALAAALRQLLERPDEARVMREMGRQESARYDLNRVLSMYDRLYHRAAGLESLEDSTCMAAR